MLKDLRGNLFGGITAGIVAMPLALAFGEQSGLGPQAGLIGALMIGFFAALLGGTATQISGPTAPMTSLAIVLIATFSAMEGGILLTLFTFFVAGIIQILMGVFGIGKYVKYIPYPALSGFMTAIGVLIILGQIYPISGLKSPAGALNQVLEFPTLFDTLDIYELGIGIATIAVIYLFPKITKAVPSTLVALIVVSAIVYFLPFKDRVLFINSIESHIPTPQLTQIPPLNKETILLVLEYGGMLAALGAIDSLLTSVIADNITKTKHNSKRELIGQGIGNAISGIFGGLPGAGATIRTVVNINSGGTTRLSGVVHAIVLLLILLIFGEYVSFIPKSVLAGILFTVGIGVIDYKGLRHLRHVPRAEAFVLILVLILAVFMGLVEAIVVGVVLSSLLFMRQAEEIGVAKTEVTSLENFKKEMPWMDEKDLFKDIPEDAVYVKHLYGFLFFGISSEFQKMIKNLPDVKIVIIRFERVPYIDQTGLYALEDSILDLERRGIEVYLTGVKGQPLSMLKALKVVPELIGTGHIFKNIEDCAIHVSNVLEKSQKKE
ncbi:SulP family inorganic anion transporter [Aureivirga sp. CE67]|uniref:SulP family inorganic anion transporter n=1 Tax=Aureivirga sp. CE67 TaxID=1788983 RepID=UPI0018CA651D|nr:SulP family inorganic anion transporter [Aureivirga sp. CE67]